ncbi:MAG TPA: hypothetical protein VEA99_04740, partial [Gemmatimonadaceae bacterium]|nr:hypothetical protein [Gemmatimonadaceae bacterium]
MTSLMADAGTRAERTGAPWWLHAAAAAFVLLMLLLARTREGTYAALLQEDRLVEWWTFALFLAAGLVFGVRALRERRLGDGGVALFCLAAA